MAPSSLKKMSRSRKRKEGNYASSDRSSSSDAFTSDDLGLTLLPGPQIQKEDKGKKAKTVNGSPTKPCVAGQKVEDYPQLSEAGNWQTGTGRHTVDEATSGSSYSELDKGLQLYTNAGPINREAVHGPYGWGSGTRGDDHFKRNCFSSPSETLSQDTEGLQHERCENAKLTRPRYRSLVPKKRRKIDGDVSFHSSNQVFAKETTVDNLNTASGSLADVVGNEHDYDSGSCGKSHEYLPVHGFHGSEANIPAKLHPASSSGDSSGFVFDKSLVGQNISDSHAQILSVNSAQQPHHSICTFERDGIGSVTPVTNNCSQISPAFLLSLKLQHPGRTTSTSHQKAPDTPRLSIQLTAKPPLASLNLQTDHPKNVLKLGKHIRRSWTRHFPLSFKALPSEGRTTCHDYSSSAMQACSTTSEPRTKSLKNCLARESFCDLGTHLNSNILQKFPPLLAQIFTRASYTLESYTCNDNIDTGKIVEPWFKVPIKSSNSLPDLRLFHRSSSMDSQQDHDPCQYPTPPRERRASVDNVQSPSLPINLLLMNDTGHRRVGMSRGNVDTPPAIEASQNMQANVVQPYQHLPDRNITAPINRYISFQLPVHGASGQSPMSHQFPTVNGRADSDGQPHHQRIYRETVVHAVLNKCMLHCEQRCQMLNDDLNQTRNQSTIDRAKFEGIGRTIKEQKNTINYQRQQFELQRQRFEQQIRIQSHQIKSMESTIATLKDKFETKSSEMQGVARTLKYARQSHPVAAQQSAIVSQDFSTKSPTIDFTNKGVASPLDNTATASTSNFPVQNQPASVFPATGHPPTQATNLQIASSSSVQSQPQVAPAHYDSASSSRPQPINQYAPIQDQPGYYAHDQALLVQQSYDHQSSGYHQLPPNVPIYHPLPPSELAEALHNGRKRKRTAEPNDLQVQKRKQQPVPAEPVSSPEQAAQDEKKQAEALKKIAEKPLDWLDGVHPFRGIKQQDKQYQRKQFGLPSATQPHDDPARPHFTTQKSRGLIAPTPGKTSRRSTTTAPPKSMEVPLNEEQKKEKEKRQRAMYNKTYRAKRKERKLFQQQAAQNSSASEASPPQSSEIDELLPGVPVDTTRADEDVDFDDHFVEKTNENQGMEEMSEEEQQRLGEEIIAALISQDAEEQADSEEENDDNEEEEGGDEEQADAQEESAAEVAIPKAANNTGEPVAQLPKKKQMVMIDGVLTEWDSDWSEEE